MKLKLKRQRGQALIIIAFAIIGLVAITGLAVDGSLAFSDRRHAQNAADTAAMAGALAKISADPYWTVVARNRALDNGYTDNKVSNTVYVYTCDDPASSCGVNYAGDPDYVQVVIESHIDTFFARVIGITKMDNRVQAVALANAGGSLYGEENIIALKQDCKEPGTFIVEGNTTVNLEDDDGGLGGLYVNTDSACGFTCNSAGPIINGDITTAGGEIDDTGVCSADGVSSTDGDQWEFPVTLDDFGIDVPSECTSPVGSYKNYNGTYDGTTTPADTGDDGIYVGMELTVLTPGYYNDFPPPKLIEEGKLYENILMLPGVYCVDHVIKFTETNPKLLIGKNVTIFIRAGYDFNINGGEVHLDAPDEGDYAGYLIIVEPDYGDPLLSEPPLACIINGGSSNTFEGAVLAPYCDVTVDGNSENIGLSSQIIAYTVKITGGGTVNITYDADKSPVLDAEIGLIE